MSDVIKLTNDVQISQESINGITGFDVSNEIAKFCTNTYTATEDCVIVSTGSGSGNEYLACCIDGVGVANYTPGSHHQICMPLKKNQVVTILENGSLMTGTSFYYYVYGLKK